MGRGTMVEVNARIPICMHAHILACPPTRPRIAARHRRCAAVQAPAGAFIFLHACLRKCLLVCQHACGHTYVYTHAESVFLCVEVWAACRDLLNYGPENSIWGRVWIDGPSRRGLGHHKFRPASRKGFGITSCVAMR